MTRWLLLPSFQNNLFCEVSHWACNWPTAFISSLKIGPEIEAACYSETLVTTDKTRRLHISENNRSYCWQVQHSVWNPVVQCWATFWHEGQIKRRNVCGEHYNNTHIFYLCIINDNGLSSLPPMLGQLNLFQIDLTNFDSIVQILKLILLLNYLSFIIRSEWDKLRSMPWLRHSFLFVFIFEPMRLI